jgi:hypothetical protein
LLANKEGQALGTEAATTHSESSKKRIDTSSWSFLTGIPPENDENDELSRRATRAALESLRSALYSAPPEDSAELARWAGVDPSLEPLRAAAETDVAALTAIFLADRDPDPDQRRRTHRKGRRDPEVQ